tara:strand:- start:122 stop:631 length:510 start_codon:yes stop_codon:yes gene_type:complete
MKCFFFDRDGVLIKNYGYFCNIDKIKWLNGAIRAIRILNKQKIKVIIITNQSGIARGYFSEKKLKEFHKLMNLMISKKKAKIDSFYFCPYHPKGKIKKYSKNSKLRKPNNGMLVRAIKRYKVSPSDCFMIGDQKIDYLCAKKTKVLFEYKKKYSLDKQVINILRRTNVI